MHPISAEQLLLIWQQVHSYSMLPKTLLLLEMITPESKKTDVGLLSIGQRDTRLLQLRKYLFGSTLHNTTICPECNTKMEWDMDLQDLIIQEVDNSEFSLEHTIEVDNFKIRFRLPNSKDILMILSKDDDKSKSNALINNCILEIKAINSNNKIKSIPKKIIRTLAEKIPELDPAADIRMNITCPSCENRWMVVFDIMSYLWWEIDNWVQKTLQEVYILASAFGWSEKDILNMDAERRHIYIGMIRS